MRVFASIIILCLYLPLLAEASSPAEQDSDTPGKNSNNVEAARGYVVGISPFLDATAKDAVYRGLVRLIVEGLPLNTRLEVYDAFNLTSITRFSIPNAKVFNSPKTRANQFAASIGEIKQFLAREHAKPAGSKSGFNAAIRFPQFCDFLAGDRLRQSSSGIPPVLLIGSPLYEDAKEPAFSMVNGYFPSDGHLRASREESIYGINPGESASSGLQVYWVYFGDPWMSELHRDKVTRFWGLYIGQRGGVLASFTADLTTALAAFSSEAPGPTAASKGWVADPLQSKPEMLRVGRSIELADWLTGDTVTGGTPPPPTRMTGPLKIGIRWKQNIDLDLYAAPRRGGETLFFQHMRSPEGYYFKDQRSSPGREYEYIEFESPVDVREARAFVNFYAGACPDGPHGEVRIEFLNRIYTGSFAIAAPNGNQGRSGSNQTDYWTEISIPEILRISKAAQSPQAAR